MLKKICMFMAALFVMLLSCAGPCMLDTHASAAGYPTTISEAYDYYSSESSYSPNYYNIWFTFDDSWYGTNTTFGLLFSIPKSDFDTDYYCEYSNNILVLRYNKTLANGCSYELGLASESRTYFRGRDAYAIQLNFNDNTGMVIDTDGDGIYAGHDINSFHFENFDTDLPQYQPNLLNLAVSFNPSLSGTVSRNQTINGKEYESKTLDLSISNNGSTAQWAMFIVPHGETVSFPSNTLEDNKGFTGNPVFVYVADEWSSFNVGMVGSAVYAPCSWHTIPAGFQNQTYSISWSQMCLQANTEYDVIVYGCLNTTALQTNTSSQWEMRPVYTVSSDLSGVEQVYKSTFTISDPAEFNPNYVDESGSSHSWNPNTDNSNLFNVSSAYRDDYGNIVIRGQTNGGNNVLSPGLSVDNMNVNSLFGDTFKFFNKILSMFPPAWVSLITIGLGAIVAIAIIKKVTQ